MEMRASRETRPLRTHRAYLGLAWRLDKVDEHEGSLDGRTSDGSCTIVMMIIIIIVVVIVIIIIIKK
jgi:hypothetical protein